MASNSPEPPVLLDLLGEARAQPALNPLNPRSTR